jgi:hypothetical protein
VSVCGNIAALQEDLPVSDFCLSPHTTAAIARQARLMDRMVLRAGIGPSSSARSDDPTLWQEARLKCIGCAESQRCMQFLASPGSAEQTQAPGFCANRMFFATWSAT